MSLGAELGLGAVFTMIALAPMVPDWIKGNPKPETKVNVMVGLPQLTPEEQGRKEEIYAKQSFGGCAPSIGLFNANGDRVGYFDNTGCKDHIDQNAPKDLMAKYHKPGNTEKSEYITISAGGPDAICISAVTVTFPSSSDIYAFLPGEVAAVCRQHDPARHAYDISYSESTVQFKDPKSGKTEDGRPRCLWIDRPDKDGKFQSKWQGFQVHLPDFKLDNSTFKGWEADPGQMCDALSRFSGYETLTHMMCPQVFSPAPMAGEALPLHEITPCFPGVLAPPDGGNNGKPFTTPCDDTRLTFSEKYHISNSYGKPCRLKTCPRYCGRHRRSSTPSQAAPIAYRNTEFVTDDGFPTEHHPLQKRFAGMLMKTRDVTQSAEQACTDPGMVGPDIYDHKGMFCDMMKRKLYPTCQGEEDVDCFDPVLNTTRYALEGRGEQRKEYFRIRDLF